ncbi:hypothetical protein [Roseovarius rhodophyticola]|uniref:Uncharacterized protein n=1 Tax=Roseovarius rhodophyticola TaxID=3080827 RepID=A0ABZ2TI51_9RHOB|nr:hypothetical protein [Roseovarius sp. W115]MDV2929599.1 hypothetical protein [Roseovarius sp. W115]
MTFVILLLGGAAAVVLAILALAIVATKDRPIVSFLTIFAVLVFAFTLGGLWQKTTFVNRHLDMCGDETSRYFVKYGRFDPYCEVFAK